MLAAGATVTWFGTPGAAEHGLPLYTLDDATRLRNHVLERFEAADRDPAEVDRGGLTFVVVGGGPTGVETAGALAELFAMVFRKDYPNLDVSRARVVLVEMQDHLLHPFTASSRRHALETLRSRGVDVRLGAQVASVVVGRGDPRRRRGAAVPDADLGGRRASRTRWPPPSTSRRGAAAG